MLHPFKNQQREVIVIIMALDEVIAIIIMACKTAAYPDAYCLDLHIRLSVECKRQSYFFSSDTCQSSRTYAYDILCAEIPHIL